MILQKIFENYNAFLVILSGKAHSIMFPTLLPELDMEAYQ